MSRRGLTFFHLAATDCGCAAEASSFLGCSDLLSKRLKKFPKAVTKHDRRVQNGITLFVVIAANFQRDINLLGG